MGLISQAKHGVAWSFLQQVSIQGINFIVQIFLARILMPSDFGLIAMISIFIALGQSLSDSGMTSSLIRGKENTEEDYNTVFITNLIISLFLYVLVFFLAPFVADFYNQEILTKLLRVYALVFIISSFSTVQLTKFTKELNFKTQFIYQLPSVIIGAFVAFYMATNGYGVWSLIGLNITQAISLSLILLLLYKWRPKLSFDKDRFKYHFDFGYKLTISGIINTIYLNLYKIIIGKQFSASEVGLFTQADNLRLFPINQISAVLNKVTFPLFAKIQDDNDKLREAYKTALRLVLSISSATMLILFLIAKPMFLLILGVKWIGAINFFQILCIASIFLPIGSYNLNILKIKGRSDLFLKVEVIKKVIGIIALFLSIPFGIEAIVWCLCITNIFFAYLNGYYSGKFINYSVFKQITNSLSIIIIALIPMVIIFLLNKYIEIDNYIIDIFKIIFIYLIIYLPLVYVFNKPLINDLKLFLKK